MGVPTSPIPEVDLLAVHRGGYQDRIDRIVIHATSPMTWSVDTVSAAGVAWGTANYFQNPAAGGSAHTVSDAGGIVRCVPENVEAWHAPPNPRSLGNEIAGHPDLTRAEWLSGDRWKACLNCAAETRAQALRWELPIVRLSVADLDAGRRGICGHFDVSQAWHQSDHWDPGPNFPWDDFMGEVDRKQGHPSPPSKDDDMNRDETITLLRAPEFSQAKTREQVAALDKRTATVEQQLKAALLLLKAINDTVNAPKEG